LEIDQEDLVQYLEYVKENHKSIFGTTRTNDKYSVIVLQCLIEIFQPNKVLISNYGLKEGVRYTSLPPEERYKDVIFERCKAFIGYVDNSIDLDGYAYVIQQVLNVKEEEFFEINDIIKITLMFLHFRRGVDRNFYGYFLSHAILMSDIPFTHKQRAMIALITSAAFGKPNNYIQQLANNVLKPTEHKIATIIAKLINVSLILDGPYLSTKCSFAIDEENGKLSIKTSETLPFNLYHNVSKQLKSVAKTMPK
jgi:exopolyphosphatase/guanosine-5'-triphosphate,3'-diphosphate pyrophosphatase